MEMKAGRRPETAESVTGIVVNGQWHELSPPASGTLLALPRSGLGHVPMETRAAWPSGPMAG